MWSAYITVIGTRYVTGTFIKIYCLKVWRSPQLNRSLLEGSNSKFYDIKKKLNKIIYLEGKVDAEYNFWTLIFDTEIFQGLNTDMPLTI